MLIIFNFESSTSNGSFVFAYSIKELSEGVQTVYKSSLQIFNIQLSVNLLTGLSIFSNIVLGTGKILLSI
jgi:hypothetical protein